MSVTTLNQLLDRCLSRHPRNDAFARKINGVYEDVSTEAFARRVRYLGLGLSELGIKSGDRVALLSENRLEWAIADLAILSIGAINVPIYPSLPPQQIRYLLEDSGARAIIVSNENQFEKIREISDRLAGIFATIIIDSPITRRADRDLVISFESLYDRGRRTYKTDPSLFLKLSESVQPGDIATIIYTSGTTGPPKGVLLTHRNILSNVRAVLKIFRVDRTDKVLSFLPLSHILERTAGHYAIMYAGGVIAYAESIETIPEDMVLTAPTLMITVPRFLEKMHEIILGNVAQSSRIQRWAFDWSIRAGYRHLDELSRHGNDNRVHSLSFKVANALVFSKLRKRLGGRIRFFISGGAPLPLEVARFFHAIRIPVYEGYGLTETSPVVSCNSPLEWRLGSIGRPIPGVEVKTAPNGEILVRGPNVMLGYLGRDEETKEVMVDGWLHTGDIGSFDNDGYLYITDRLKDIIVTSGGKNVAPQPIEALLKRSRFIKEAVLIGNRRKYISALIVPDIGKMSQNIDRTGPVPSDRQITINNPKIREIIEAEIEERCRDLAPYEKIKKFHLIAHDFRIGTDELTPTLKVKRYQIEQRYGNLIDSMYR